MNIETCFINFTAALKRQFQTRPYIVTMLACDDDKKEWRKSRTNKNKFSVQLMMSSGMIQLSIF